MSGVCGKPTKSGRPCQVGWGLVWSACSRHATDEDRATTKRLFDEWHAAWAEEHADEIAAREQQFKEMEQKRLARVEEDKRNWREYTADGRQIVCVGNYAYTWHGDPLQVGDRVLLPGNWLFPHTREAAITSLGSSYVGELAAVLNTVDSLASIG